MASIRIRNLTKRFSPVTSVNDLSIDIADEEFVRLLGPSGCGKTTTPQMLAGFLQPDGGTIHIDDQLVSSAATMEQREMGMVFPGLSRLAAQAPERGSKTIDLACVRSLPSAGNALTSSAELVQSKKVPAVSRHR